MRGNAINFFVEQNLFNFLWQSFMPMLFLMFMNKNCHELFPSQYFYFIFYIIILSSSNDLGMASVHV